MWLLLIYSAIVLYTCSHYICLFHFLLHTSPISKNMHNFFGAVLRRNKLLISRGFFRFLATATRNLLGWHSRLKKRQEISFIKQLLYFLNVTLFDDIVFLFLCFPTTQTHLMRRRARFLVYYHSFYFQWKCE